MIYFDFQVQDYIKAIEKFRCRNYECDPEKMKNIIVTSEDEKIVREAIEYGTKKNFNIIVNEFDVMQVCYDVIIILL